MNTRTFLQPNRFATQKWSNPANCCKIVYGGDRTIVVGGGSGAYSGARTPRFHKVVKSGGMLPLNSYYRWDYQFDHQPGSLITGREFSCSGCGTYVYTNTLSNGVICPLSGKLFYENLVAEATSMISFNNLLISAQADMLPDLDALTTLVEARGTIDMVLKARKTAKSLILKALRGGKHTAKAASDAWLSWRYGWQTLGYDVQAAYKLLKEPLTHVFVTGQSGDSVTFDRKSGGPWANGWEAGTDTFHHSVDVSARARSVGEVNLTTLNVLVDPAITLWELVPYSFVADWFVNVGECLAAWNARRTFSSLDSSIGVKASVKGKHTRVITGNSLPNNYVFVRGYASSSESYTSKSRSPGWSPSLVPSITVELNSKRIADAAALLLKRIL